MRSFILFAVILSAIVAIVPVAGFTKDPKILASLNACAKETTWTKDTFTLICDRKEGLFREQEGPDHILYLCIYKAAGIFPLDTSGDFEMNPEGAKNIVTDEDEQVAICVFETCKNETEMQEDAAEYAAAIYVCVSSKHEEAFERNCRFFGNQLQWAKTDQFTRRD